MILIEVDGRSFPKKGSSTCVRLSCNDHKWVRTFTSGKITSNQAELKGIEFALKSIAQQFHEDPILIKTSGRYAVMMLERDGDGNYIKNIKSNVGLMTLVRKLYNRHPKISIESHGNLEGMRDYNVQTLRDKKVVDIREG